MPHAALESPRQHLVAVGLLLLTAVLWSLGGMLIKLVDWHPVAIAGARSGIAVPIVACWAGWPKWRYTRLQWIGAVAYLATVVFFVSATRLTTAANAIFLQYTAPIYVALLAPMVLGERSKPSDWAAIAIALAGVALFFVEQLSFAGFWGNVLAVLSGISFASMALCLRKERAGEPMQVVLLGNMLTAVVGIPFMIHAGPPPSQSWLPLLLLGTIQLGLSYVLYTVAIKRVTALEATLLTLLEPVLNPVWVMITIGERPGGWAAIGGGLVVASVIARGLIGSGWFARRT